MTAERNEIDRAADITRSAIAHQTLKKDNFIEQLGDDYQLRFIRFGDSPEEFDGEQWLESGQLPTDSPSPSFSRATDLTSALESILDQIPADDLAGILLLSDGRHNGERPIDEVARRLGIQQAPVSAINIGSSTGPRDARILDVRVPETIYLDDRAIIQADLQFDSMLGENITISLLKDKELLDSRQLEITEPSQRSTIRFAHTPDQIGLSDYTVQVSLSPGETFTENNRWDFNVAVTDDRTNVLIIESYPRWEFRYLRNLFHARDKSVHLQYVLLDPDEITGAAPPAEVIASADRKFGDSEATAIPQERDEWLKFDAIILGDIPPSAIDARTWKNIQFAVAERACLLITIAGPRFMPHAHSSPIFKELLPITYEPSSNPQIKAPEQSYRLRLTPAGRTNPITQQSIDPNLNELIWGSLPALHWRHAITGVKPGAEALAYARPTGRSKNLATSSSEQAARALIATQRYALGKVVALNFDRTWRLRYGVGDVYHHKFWGQILRWGTGEILRAGNEFIRLGTDKLSYSPGEKITVTARVTTPDHQPLTSGEVAINLVQNDKLILRRPLTLRPESNGIYETQLPPLSKTGRFRLRLDGTAVEEILQTTNHPPVETEFIIKTNPNAIELSELTAAPAFLARLATLSGGTTTDPDNAATLRSFFGPPGQIIRERRETTLWDKPPLLLLFLALLSTEWITRRKSGLV